MEDAHTYMISTEPAVAGLFKLLNEYEWNQMRALAERPYAKTQEELEHHTADFNSVNVAREVIAGSILQIAFIAIKRYGVFNGKSENSLHFERQMNRLISESSNTRVKTPFSLPEEFCVGRDIGHLPLGMLVYAARNQYNHFYENRLNVVNEVVFNHLHDLWPNPGNGFSFNINDGNNFYCYSMLAALGWRDNADALGYGHYKKDLMEMLQIES